LLEQQTRRESNHLLMVDDHHEHRRLDQFVAAALAPEWSRSQVARMIKAGLITLNGAAARASCVIRPGDRIEIPSAILQRPAEVTRFGTASAAIVSRIEILFCDSELIVVNKPAGMPVHPSAGHPDSTLVNELLVQFPELAEIDEPGGLMRAGIVHRLDKETSGVMVVARTPFARMQLSQQFKDRAVIKLYLAIAKGVVARDRFSVDRPLGRHPTERKRMSIRSHKLRTARTDFLVLHRLEGPQSATLLKARPQTGRTHQIRVHLAAAGHPCLGDTLYGGKGNFGWARKGQALHALALTIAHPRTGERLEFVTPIPVDFCEFLSTRGLTVGPPTIRQWIEAM
jgi:23S rRNA pseudouridine1911/1915/1917 synthase